jgi:LruC domain-containing protein
VKKNTPLPLLLLALIFTGCIKKAFPDDGTTVPEEQQTKNNLLPTAGFKFNTSSEIEVEITTLDYDDNPVPGIRINIFSDYPENGGSKILSCFTGANEVHLLNQPPTDLANTTLFGTQSDRSNPATAQYYLTRNNLPFAIDIAKAFEYPVEKKVITQAHLKFYQWAALGGWQYRDWYIITTTDYRNAADIFKS